MADIQSIAKCFFEACETGRGWEVCRHFCTPTATFSSQAEPLAEVKTLEAYAQWMQGLLKFMPERQLRSPLVRGRRTTAEC